MNKVIDFIISNGVTIFSLLAVVVFLFAMGIKFAQLSRERQIEKVKEWLKWAVALAEQTYGSKTGQLKLAYVYNLFIERFPWLSKVFSFEQFSKLVDDALTWLNNQLSNNVTFASKIVGD